ncbi:hypothetical protein HAX54_048922 [Datura stramonium]|uniref:Uncharacterized protein n=1 Tax=Datura stramonium TaxID=4076 RepID=A0ABS8WJW4_DATST|nr:hypothetical protein [Datura stramonium]
MSSLGHVQATKTTRCLHISNNINNHHIEGVSMMAIKGSPIDGTTAVHLRPSFVSKYACAGDPQRTNSQSHLFSPLEIMNDLPIHKIQISGTTLASVLHRFFSSSGDIHGLLFGHVSFSTTISLSDDLTSNFSTVTTTDSASSSAADGPTLTATITDFLSIPSHFPLPLQHHHRDDPSSVLVGWFSGRRKTPLRPSVKDSTTTLSLASSASHSFTPLDSPYPLSLPPSLFLLLSTPFQEQLIHTHEYKAFQYRVSTDSFDLKSLDIINIGPSFRSHYGSFSPIYLFNGCDLRGPNAMAEDEKVETLVGIKKGLKD